MHLTSTISISLVLFLIGLMCLILFTAHEMSTHVKENINISVILEDNIKDDYVKRIERYLQAAPYTKSVEYVSKESALEDLVSSLGEDPQSFLGYNPLLASFEVKLNAPYANNDSLALIESKLKTFDHVSRIIYQKDVIALVNNNIHKISIIILGLVLVLLLISIALINNTIRLAIYSNRFLINTMKLVGAKSWFIRKPYVKRSMRNGLIAALLAIIYIGLLLYYARYEFGLDEMVISVQTSGLVCGAIILTGIILTGISSYFAVGRYVRMSTNDMYFV
ncbi:cell division protein FtsX [Paludibacter sp. 221]|nr:cell division protein FtsX [Paludibacter sp. 221]